MSLGFLGGSVVKNPPANAGDTGAVPDPGRSHMPQGNWAHEPQLGSLCSRAQEPQLLMPTVHPPTRKATAMRSPHTTTRDQPPLTQTRESLCSCEDAEQPKYK